MNGSENLPNSTANSIGMEFVSIPIGSFKMGGDKILEQAEDHENPIHTVRFKESILMGKYTVTQGQWSEVMKNNPSGFKDDLRPVETISWNDVQAFIKALNNREKTDCYRLPTEAEWEYAARAGSESAYAFGSETSALDQYAWYRKNSKTRRTRSGYWNPMPGACMTCMAMYMSGARTGLTGNIMPRALHMRRAVLQKAWLNPCAGETGGARGGTAGAHHAVWVLRTAAAIGWGFVWSAGLSQ